MNRFVVLSDIHGNLEALNRVLAEVDRLNVEGVICLGDVVGYGPNPTECCEIAQERFRVTLMGNHDAASVGKMDIDYFNPAAKKAILWTSLQLLPEHKEFLFSLPYTYTLGDLFFVHGTPNSPEAFYYLLWDVDLEVAFQSFTQWICFLGHSHRAGIYGLQNDEIADEYPRTVLSREKRYIVNVGSVGQARDGDFRAAFALIDLEQNNLEILRVAYPVEIVQKKILDKGLPSILAERLAYGF